MDALLLLVLNFLFFWFVSLFSDAEAFPAMLMLERALSSGLELEALRALDGARHRRFLQPSSVAAGVVDFTLAGSSNPFTYGLYFTRIKLGNPSKEFYVQIDTGSDILWVSCDPCSGCPTSSGLNVQLESFDPKISSTASVINCMDNKCIYGLQNLEASCPSSYISSSPCFYSFQYGDGSGTSGYYVSDTLYFDTFLWDQQTANSSATIVFGCSNLQYGDLSKPDRAVDGIFGFGQNELSVISQLSSLGVAPKVFSHCLKGSDGGGGILVLGEIVEPGIVYTPIIQSQHHYNLNLMGISVNGQALQIDSSVFATSSNGGTIIDSGTTLAYLADQAYDVFVDAITATVEPSVQPLLSKGNQCFISTTSVNEAFPLVALIFYGGAIMVLKPQDYLLQQVSINDDTIWCFGWQRGQGVTILGDIVLKDKIFVYDLAGQRLGWVDYDCSLPVNVSTTFGNNVLANAARQMGINGSPRCTVDMKLSRSISLFLLVHYLIISNEFRVFNSLFKFAFQLVVFKSLYLQLLVIK